MTPTGEEIVVVSNDVIPGMALPVAAPGLRAWGLARGLRQRGHRVHLAVNSHVVRRVRRSAVAPPRPPGTIIASTAEIGDFIRTVRPRAVVVTNSNHVEALGPLGDAKLVYDFFAPKMLELQQRPDVTEGEIAELRTRKIDALSRSDAVIINGAKKRDYVQSWLQAAGVADIPTAVVNMPIDPVPPRPRGEPGVVHAVIAGYLQPWSHPGDWTDSLYPPISDGRLVLHMLVASHWGGRADRETLPAEFARLAEHDNVVTHGTMDYVDFRRFLGTCDVSLDIFRHNTERELAMVTRTAVALATGVPVIHVPFTEVTPMVRQHDAGWIVGQDDEAAVSNALDEASSPELLATKRAGAAKVAELLAPVAAVAPLHRLLVESLDE